MWVTCAGELAGCALASCVPILGRFLVSVSPRKKLLDAQGLWFHNQNESCNLHPEEWPFHQVISILERERKKERKGRG